MVTSLVTWRTVFCSYALGAGYAGGGVSLGVSVCFSGEVGPVFSGGVSSCSGA